MKNILIVDDSPLIRRTLRTLLERRPEWQICGEAESGSEGIEKAVALVPDLVLMDLSMPGMNGFQAARELRSLLPTIPIIMFTAFSNPHIEREAKAIGINSVQSKSEPVDFLYRSIGEVLTNR